MITITPDKLFAYNFQIKMYENTYFLYRIYKYSPTYSNNIQIFPRIQEAFLHCFYIFYFYINSARDFK